MKNDKELHIATGQSRKTKTWQNRTALWSELVSDLSETVYTDETVDEYHKMSKDDQDAIKDVGGFVGGYLIKGSRKNVKFRDIVTLDIDFGDLGVWDVYSMIYGNAAVLYSTHKHTREKPRLRLIIPLDRSVTPEEYEAIARRIAGDLDINIFDDTTYQPQRLMYWPSTSKDGEYVFKSRDDTFTKADEILSSYHDWHDISEWPVSDRQKTVVKKEADKQQNPLEKDGVIGAFCRAYYPISLVIEKYVTDYEPTTESNRYTYKKGSTSGGVLVYDDTFTYSYHDTDPASGVLCNAFDLVRLHRFKNLDEKAKPNTPAHRMPSFIAMEELATNDERVKPEILSDLIDDFDMEDEEDTKWTTKLQLSKQGKILPTYKNLLLILTNDKNLKGRFGYNEMSKQEVLVKETPWRRVAKNEEAISDTDDANIRVYLERKYSITGKDKIFDAVNVVCHQNSYHPVKEYLESLKWDGIKRLEDLFIDYFGVEPSEYIRTVSRKTLIAAVSRIYEPGCKFDTMLTVYGPQGCGKSSFFEKLSKGWFTDSLKDIRNKDALEGLQGVWIVEMAEMTALKKADSEAIKSFLSGTTDRFRMAYGRRTRNYPRSCIFVATTNEMSFLRDKTGNRRFWIVDIPKNARPSKSVFTITSDVIDQIWAEAKHLYDYHKEPLYLSHEMEQEAIRMQESFMQDDPRVSIIHDYLDRKLPENWYEMDLIDRQLWLASDDKGTLERTKVYAAEVWTEALGYDDIKKLNSYEVSEINKIIDMRPEWQKAVVKIKGLKNAVRGFQKINAK
ncbi:hypothetical protein B7939_00890 [Eggerthia catenaformis]|nr:hypothetical protein B7939_00890 [Eggerthia catenaformis]